MNEPCILAVVVERRILAAVVLRQGRPMFAEIRNLRPSVEEATWTVEEVVGRLVNSFPIDYAILLAPPEAPAWRRSVLTRAASAVLSRLGIAVFETYKAVVLGRFGVPALRSRTELRKIMRPLWAAHSVDDPAPYVLDAFAVGLVAHLEQLLKAIEEEL